MDEMGKAIVFKRKNKGVARNKKMASFHSDQQKKDKKIASSVSQSQNVSHSFLI